MYFLSLDFGTSALKLAVVSENLEIAQTASAAYPYILLPGEKVEIDPDRLWAACYEACAQIDPELRGRIEVVCYDTFSPSPVLIKGDGTLSYPNIITHLDRRSRAQSDYIDRVVGNDRYASITGVLPFPGGVGAMTFIWFNQNEPNRLRQADRIGHLPTYVHRRMTGEWCVDLVNASMMGLYETTIQTSWSDELLDAFDLHPRLLSEIVSPGSVLGALKPEEATRMGLRGGIPVAVGTNDMAAAQMGAGNEAAGCVMNAAGSSDMVSILTDRPVISPNYYLRNSALPGLWQIYATTAGGFAVDWFYNQFCREMSRDHFNGAYLTETLEAWRHDGDVTFAPFLTGDRQSLEKKTGAWNGLTLAASREEMLAALLKSMNRVLAATLAEAGTVQELRPLIKLTGGMVCPALIALKEREMPGFGFEVVDNCSILGNVVLAKRSLVM